MFGKEGNRVTDSDAQRWSLEGGKCPSCGSRKIEDCNICTADNVECDGYPCEWADNGYGVRSECCERKLGLKCEHCDHVWRE